MEILEAPFKSLEAVEAPSLEAVEAPFKSLETTVEAPFK